MNGSQDTNLWEDLKMCQEFLAEAERALASAQHSVAFWGAEIVKVEWSIARFADDK